MGTKICGLDGAVPAPKADTGLGVITNIIAELEYRVCDAHSAMRVLEEKLCGYARLSSGGTPVAHSEGFVPGTVDRLSELLSEISDLRRDIQTLSGRLDN